MKILYDLIKALLETGLLTAILVIVSFISKAFHIDGFVALMIVVLVLQIFSGDDWLCIWKI
ncbi:hypothetical protein [Limosilactobacillus mucosae]|uniref:hypothetical protein n=1 Tax=Limosilactobacillus mucosae TaxID=97478 RepID=UPI003CFFA407